MRYSDSKMTVFFFISCMILPCMFNHAWATTCDECLESCKGLDNCCTGTGCLCEEECVGYCPPPTSMKYYCTLTGVCWPIGCKCSTPSVPDLISPSNNAIRVSVTPRLSWSNVSYAESYSVNICSDSNCSSILLASTQSTNSWQVSPALSPGTTYWWQVNVKNTCGNSSSWSAAKKFTTVCSSPLGIPDLLTPSDGATDIPISPTLDWSDVTCSSAYKVRVCSDSNCSSVVIASSPLLKSEWHMPSGLNANTTYWWQVQAMNSNETGSWSAYGQFITSAYPLLLNDVPLNDEITSSTSGGAWKYYYTYIPSGAGDLIISLSNLSADADLYARYSEKPGLDVYDCGVLASGTTEEMCIGELPSPGWLWIGVNNYDTGTISYTVSVSWTSIDNDIDDDGLSNEEEDINQDGVIDTGETDPNDADTDGDGIQDGTELGETAGVADPDGDEHLLGTDMAVFIPDADPTTTTDPLDPDTDEDWLKDGQEDVNFNGRIDSGETDPAVYNAPEDEFPWEIFYPAFTGK